MNNIQEASKKDKLWRSYALKVTGNKNDADEIVQEMYIKLTKVKKEVNDFYILLMIKSIFLDQKKKKKRIIYMEDGFLQTFFREENFEINDEQKKAIDRFDKLPFHQKELILESYDKSLRAIEKEFNINYGYVHREIKKAKKKILGSGQAKEKIQ